MSIYDKLNNNTLWELEQKRIPFDGQNLAAHRFNSLSHPTRNDLMRNGCKLYDAPEPYQSQFDKLSESERAAFRQADGVICGAR